MGETTSSGFHTFENTAADAVSAIQYDAGGDRIVTASADHRLRIYQKSCVDSNDWELYDQWRGHDAEVKWIDSSHGEVLTTIGGDNKFKVWQENPSQAHTRGRRFKCIFSQTPVDSVAYIAFDYIVRQQDIYVALISHTGLFTLLEPADPTTLSSWREGDAFYPFGQQPRSSEARFSISFHHAAGPNSQALRAGIDKSSISLAISSASQVNVYRFANPEDENVALQEVLRMPFEDGLVCSVAWAPAHPQPEDVVAVACDDGKIRMLEITVQTSSQNLLTSNGHSNLSALRRGSRNDQQLGRSGIAAGLANIDRPREVSQSEQGNGPKHEGKIVAELQTSEGASAHQMEWTMDGCTLVTTGDDGKAHLWKRSLAGNWMQYAETAFQ
ncbi:uncharacterized protein KY384_003279 [Bacidia gigantensis]|uniref:uncharacterized protein n=1 Tax=Bacidia gigantensis TaxID=2732470 RepID=UPI001D04F21B|nr:uncharacterized protein KY384_003279 [Bacidia gigantensis]KAG8531648.1 hypothetical protein KY384_003279 [Bacidia gigantensis]